jgi:hypothetical protein
MLSWSSSEGSRTKAAVEGWILILLGDPHEYNLGVVQYN